MGHEAIKLELIECLAKLEDAQTIEYLKIVKVSKSKNQDWWDDLTNEQKRGIERGIKDIDDGRIIPHDEVIKRYGL